MDLISPLEPSLKGHTHSFKSLTQSLKDDLRIKYTPTPLNKLRYTCEAIPFDLVPFGGIEKSGEVSIPPSYDSLMNVTGYDDALRCAITYSVDDKKIKIASPEMLVSLKLVAWDENPARDRDASDIFYLMKNYEHIDPDAYTYILDNYGEVLEYFNHETTLSHVALLGIRLSNYINYANVDMINKILRDENKKERFIRGMQPEKTELEHEYEYIKAFLYGLNYE